MALKYTDIQKKAIESFNKPTLLLAVPGSGKTTVLVSKIAYLISKKNVNPKNILVLTYTKSSAKDMKERFIKLFDNLGGEDVRFTTINSFSLEVLNKYALLYKRDVPKLIEQRKKLITDIYKSIKNDFLNPNDLNEIDSFISYVKNTMAGEKEIKKINSKVDGFYDIYIAYQKYLKDMKLMDYDDQLIYALDIFKKCKDILKYFTNKYQYVLVDEAQDTSKIQHNIIYMLCQNNKNLFMVGDEDQSIYGFRGAYPKALLDFKKVYKNAEIIKMEENFRSLKNIISKADNFIKKNKKRYPKNMIGKREEEGKVTVINKITRYDQYLYLIDKLKNCNESTAVLYRNNDSALPLINLLSKNNIDYTARGNDSLFFTNSLVLDIKAFYNLSKNKGDFNSFKRIYKKIGIFKTEKEWQEILSNIDYNNILESVLRCLIDSEYENLKNLNIIISKLKTAEAKVALNLIFNYKGYKSYLEKRTDLKEKKEILLMLSREEKTLESLFKRMNELKDIIERGNSKNKKLTLSTIHSAKGLEFNNVYMIDIINGILPAYRSDFTFDDVEEERRMFYVGITRAKNNLYLFNGFSDCSTTFINDLFEKAKKEDSEFNSINYEDIKSKKKKTPDKRELALYSPGKIIIHKYRGEGRILRKYGEFISVQFENEKKELSLIVSVQNKIIKLKEN